MDVLSVVRGRSALRRWAVVSLIMNMVIVVTGGLVRLTGSGLGCPTWPKCTDESYVTHPALGVHGAIEFGNRLLTFVLIIAAVLTFVSALLYREDGRPRRDLRWLTAGMALGIPVPGRDRRHHRAHPAQPVRGRSAPGAVDDLDLARGLAGAQDPGARRGSRRRPFGDRGPGGVRVDLGHRLARHHGDRERPARRR